MAAPEARGTAGVNPTAPLGGREAGTDPGRSGAVSAVVAVGNELLSGRTLDTNSAWLGEVLALAGAPVVHRIVVRDEDQAITEAVADARRRADLVVVTGGLGPTRDDRTLDAVAGLLGLPLEVDSGLETALRERFAQRGVPLPLANLRQARVPRGGTVLPNPLGTAPGILLRPSAGPPVVLLPGVPREMQAVVREGFLPLLSALTGGRLRPVHFRSIRTTGIPESALAARLEPVIESGALGPVEVAWLPRAAEVELRLVVRAEAVGAGEAEALLDRAESVLAPHVAPWRFQGPDLVDDVARALAARGWRMATAESCTGGLLGKRLTDRPGSSAWYAGGVVAYADSVKEVLLGVPTHLLREWGAVSGPVAQAMAEGIAERLGVQVGVSITGIAGPSGGSEEKPVGTVWLGVRVGGRTETRRLTLPGDRADIRTRSAQAALHLLLVTLEGRR